MYFSYGIFESTGYLSDEQKTRREAKASNRRQDVRGSVDTENPTINVVEENEPFISWQHCLV